MHNAEVLPAGLQKVGTIRQERSSARLNLPFQLSNLSKQSECFARLAEWNDIVADHATFCFNN
jgi:hypothetical protein